MASKDLTSSGLCIGLRFDISIGKASIIAHNAVTPINFHLIKNAGEEFIEVRSTFCIKDCTMTDILDDSLVSEWLQINAKSQYCLIAFRSSDKIPLVLTFHMHSNSDTISLAVGRNFASCCHPLSISAA